LDVAIAALKAVAAGGIPLDEPEIVWLRAAVARLTEENKG
jgi:hypothetical protein